MFLIEEKPEMDDLKKKLVIKEKHSLKTLILANMQKANSIF